MRTKVVVLLAGLVLGTWISRAAANPEPKPDRCYELYTLGLITYDRAFRAMEDLEKDHPRYALMRLHRIDATWVKFNTLGQECIR